MITKAFEYAAPASLGEAAALLQRPDAVALAGGSRLITQLKAGALAPGLLVDLRRVPELHGLSHRDGALYAGALTPLAALSDTREVRASFAALAEAADASGDMQMRNSATFGGSLLAPASDTAAALLVFDAAIDIYDGAAITQLAMQSALRGLPAGAVLQAIHVGDGAGDLPAGSAYAVFKSASAAETICGIAAWVAFDTTGRIAQCRMAVTGAVAAPVRLFALEAALAGAAPEEIQPALATAADGLQCITDRAASAAYRAQLVRVLAARAMVRAMERAQA